MKLSNVTQERNLYLLLGSYRLESDGLWTRWGEGGYVTLWDEDRLIVKNLPLSVICFDIRATYFQYYTNAQS